MPFSMADLLAAYAGSPDPENPIPVDAPGAGVTPAGVLQAFGHVLAPGLVSSPFTDRIGPQGSAFTPAPTARDYATQLSRGKTNIDPLETMLGVAGGSPATFLAPGRVPGGPAAVTRFNKMVAAGATEEEARQATGVNLNAARQPQMEISDAGSTFRFPTPEEIEKGGTLGDFMSNWKPAEYMPELNRLPVVFKDPTFEQRPQSLGYFDLETNPPTLGFNPKNLNTPEKLRDAALHEAGGHGVSAVEGFPSGGSPFDPATIKRAEQAVRARKKEIEQIKTDVSQRAANWAIEQAGGDKAKAGPFIAKYFDLHDADATLMRDAIVDEAKVRRGRLKMENQFKIYESGAGEEQARVIQKSKDKTQEELLAGPSPEARSDRPYAEQLIIPNKRRSWLDELPSFSERMAGLRDVAFAGRQRGSGNILPRETTYEPPLLAPGETRGDLVGALTPGLPPAETSIADIGRRSYRERLGLEAPGRQESTKLPTTEMTDIGEQYVLPGAERLTPAQMAQRKAAESLKAKVPQEAPGGMFGPAEGEQGKMFSTQLPAEVPSDTTSLRAANTDRPAVAPSIISRANPTPADVRAIYNKLAETKRTDVWPPAENPVFKTTPEAYAETQSLVPQRSIAGELPQMPDPSGQLPLNDRARTLMTLAEPTAARIAERLQPMVASQSPLLDFYQTGPVIRGLAEHAVGDVPAANAFMRDWSGQGAATSPRTQTPPNLRNASHLLYQRAQGTPVTPDVWEAQGNVPGLPMMRMHVDLADKFAQGTANPLKNPKPFTFRENWAGNQLDPTIDTHNIRSTLFLIDQQRPGSLPREWFTSDRAYYNYKEGGGFNSGKIQPGDINDELAVKALNKVESQVEYPIVQQPWRRAAEMLGITPAQAQSGGWFEFGPITGLRSPPQTIPDLLNNQIEATAKVLNVPPQKVLEWWGQGKIPLAGIAGGVTMADVLLGQSKDQQ